MDHPPSSSTIRLPIANLSPSLDSISSSSIKAKIALIWPYSSSSRTFGFLLAEPDVRRRASKGQVRVDLQGSSAKAAAKSRVGIEDVVVLRLEGVEWKRHHEKTSIVGQSLDWDLQFTERIYLEVYRDGQHFTTIDIDHPPTSPLPQRPLPLPLPAAARLRSQPLNGAHDSPGGDDSVVLSSPAFLKHPRLSSGSLLNTPLDPFADDDGYILGRGRKRPKLSQVEDNQTHVTDPIESTRAPAETTSPLANHAGNDDSAMLSTMEDAQTQTTFVAEAIVESVHDEDTDMSDAPLSSREHLFQANRDREATQSVENGHAELLEKGLATASSPAVDSDVAEDSEPLQATAPSTLEQADEALPRPDEELIYSSSEEDETPSHMPTPRIEPLASPGLPLISPLIQRSGPPGSYFQFPPKQQSELDASSVSPTAEYPSLPPFESVPHLAVEASAPVDPVIADPFKKRRASDLAGELEEDDEGYDREDIHEDDSQEYSDEDEESESDDGYVEQEPGSLQFESLRSDVPPVLESFEEQEYEEEDSNNEQAIIDEELSSSFEGFSTPGEPLRAGDDADQVSGEENMYQTEDEVEGVSRDGTSEGEERAAVIQEHMPESELEEHETGPNEPRERPSEGEIPDKKMTDIEGAEDDPEVEARNEEESKAAEGNDFEHIGDDKEDEELESEEEEEMVSDAEEMEEIKSGAQELEAHEENAPRMPTIDGVIDLTEDLEEEESSLESNSEIEDVLADREGLLDEEEQYSDDEHQGMKDHEDGEDHEGRSSRSPRFSDSACADEEAVGQEEDIPTSPVFREFPASDNQPHEEEEDERSQHELHDADRAPYPELPLRESEDTQPIQKFYPKSLLSELAQQASDVSDVLIDPRLSNQLMTPTATATASQLTSLLSRQSTVVMQEQQHDLPTPQDTQNTEIGVNYTRHSSEDAAGPLPESRPSAAKTRHRSSTDVPEAMSKWFEPRWSSQTVVIDTQEDTSEEEGEQDEEADVQDMEGQERQQQDIAEANEQHLKERTEEIPDSALQLSTYPPIEPRGLTTPNGYFPPLCLLASHFNEIVDVLAVCTTDTPKVERAKQGPKDHFTTLTLTDPSSISTSQSPDSPPQAITVVQIFRPYAKAIPSVSRGDVVLLRAFKVQTQNHKITLLSTEASAWVVFKHKAGKGDRGEEVLSGPPVEFGAEERGVVKGLWSWWQEVGEKGVQEEEKGGHALRRGSLKPTDVGEQVPDDHEEGGHALRRGSLKPTDVSEKEPDDHGKVPEKGGHALRNRAATSEIEEKSEKEMPKRAHTLRRRGGTEEAAETVVENQEKGGHALRNRGATEEAAEAREEGNEKGGHALRRTVRARTPRGGFAAVNGKG